MKPILFLAVCCFSLPCFAQNPRFQYQPRKLQLSVRAGFLGAGLHAEYRLGTKTVASVELGLGLNCVRSYYYNRFNTNYENYDVDFGDFLNLGVTWAAPHVSFELRRIITNRSSIEYNSAPFANTFSYYGLRAKRNGRDLDPNREWVMPFRETYQLGAVIGRQVELFKQSDFIFDVYLGWAILVNYSFSAVESQAIFGFRLGVPLWRVNN